jgi:hypothetical protein
MSLATDSMGWHDNQSASGILPFSEQGDLLDHSVPYRSPYYYGRALSLVTIRPKEVIDVDNNQ